ncbi:MAG: RNA 2',3'-cyclic phosphodiesterase [Thermodesulfovibrionales bacterium]|nr:RNA 2',3'-cyclic phosphodiesterase [Thermodesulfovibrionales bacterium]
MRAFIAIPIDDALKKELQGYIKQASLLTHSVRWTKRDNMHITIKFLDEITQELADKLAFELNKITKKYQPFELIINGTGTFPNLKVPRVLWVGIEKSETLHRLYQEIENLCTDVGIKKDDKAFSPHITVGRIKDKLSESMFDFIRASGNKKWGSLKVNEILLMKSVLKPEGPEYSVMKRCILPSVS